MLGWVSSSPTTAPSARPWGRKRPGYTSRSWTLFPAVGMRIGLIVRSLRIGSLRRSGPLIAFVGFEFSSIDNREQERGYYYNSGQNAHCELHGWNWKLWQQVNCSQASKNGDHASQR